MGRPSFFFMKPYPTDRRTLVEKGRSLLETPLLQK